MMRRVGWVVVSFLLGLALAAVIVALWWPDGRA
jgi:hypothetical protein